MAEPIRTASAEHLDGDAKAAQFDASSLAWMTQSWTLFRDVGEYKSAVNWIANGQSQIAIEPLMWNGQGWVPESNETALTIISELGDQPALMRKWGECSCVAGEMFLGEVRGVLRPMSRREISVTNGRFYLDEYGTSDGTGIVRMATRRRGEIPKAPEIKNLWRFYIPSAEFSGLADTPSSSFLTDLQQLLLLRLVLNAKLNARLWMNGIWTFSQSVSMPTQRGEAKTSTFLARFKALVQANMARKNGAADAMPIFLQVSGQEVGDVIKQFYPEVKIDEREAELRAEIRNTLKELFDLPVEAQTGLGSANRWSGWQVMDTNTLYSQMPRARSLVHAMSGEWYQAKLSEADVPNPENHKLEVNIAGLQGEASSDEARQAYQLGAIGGTYLRSRTRAPEDAKPDEPEYVRMLGWESKNAFLAVFGLDVADEIDWEMAAQFAGKGGRPGNDTTPADRTPDSNSPDPNNPDSEVQD